MDFCGCPEDAEPGTMSVGFIGAGQLACALVRGFTAAGERVEAGGGCACGPEPGLRTAPRATNE